MGGVCSKGALEAVFHSSGDLVWDVRTGLCGMVVVVVVTCGGDRSRREASSNRGVVQGRADVASKGVFQR